MKFKSLLLSGIILGGFTTSILPTNSFAAKANESANSQTNIKTNSIDFGSSFDLNSLNEQTSIIFPAFNNCDQDKIGNITVKLNSDQIEGLKKSHQITIRPGAIDSKSNWGGNLTFKPVSQDIQIKYDSATKTLILISDGEKTDHLNYVVSEGDALVHYITEDTKQEITSINHGDAINNGETFQVDTLKGSYPEMIGYFDALNMDFDDVEDEDGAIFFKRQNINLSYDIKNINKGNTEFNIYLKKASPATEKLEIYKNDKLFSQKELSSELWQDVLTEDDPKLADPKIPDENIYTLDKHKTTSISYSDYTKGKHKFTATGLLVHRTAFNDANDHYLNTLYENIYGDNNRFINENLVGHHAVLKLNYYSKMITGTTTVNSNLGSQTIKDIKGHVGEEYSVNVPKHDGYKANKKKIKVKINQDGTITALESIEYSKIDDPSSDNNGSDQTTGNNNPENPSINENNDSPVMTEISALVATHKQNVTMYSINGDSAKKVENRVLGPTTDWKVAHKLILNGTTYYQVSTNEWVKSDDVYRFENTHGVISTIGPSTTDMVNSNMKSADRGLAADTSWQFDRVAYLGAKEEPHFRVSTNEFVHFGQVLKN